jgi:uncharacterized lipoprotein
VNIQRSSTMKLKIAFVAVLIMASCSSPDETEGEAVTPETKEKAEDLQETNIELEQLDGDLDSLLTTLK